MRPGISLDIYGRDGQILLDAGRGPIRSTVIFKRFFLHNPGKGTKATRIAIGWRRLQKMKQGGLITYFPNYRLSDMVVVLRPKGAIPVCEYFGLGHEKIWTHVPSEKSCLHDTYVGDSLRKFFDDEKAGKFVIDNYFFEDELRRVMVDPFRPKKGVGYPDLVIILLYSSGQSKAYHIEIDCGSVPIDSIRKKISFRSREPFLFIVNGKKRFWWLFDKLSEFAPKVNYRDIYITSAQEFFNKNFGECLWLRPPDKTAQKIEGD